jgi:hypothetical protein
MSPRPLLVAALLAFVACRGDASAPGDAGPAKASCPTGYAEGFTACVHACGETNDREDFAATCAADGTLRCPAGTTPAATCPNPWPGNGCGPWVNGYDCFTTSAVCLDGLFWTCPGPDAGADRS